MADIELVIKIDEEYYNAITEIPNHQCTADMLIIKNGTPLPKGHGRLIDADKLKEEIYVIDAYSEEPVRQQISDAPTIVEADKAESEDKE